MRCFSRVNMLDGVEPASEVRQSTPALLKGRSSADVRE